MAKEHSHLPIREAECALGQALLVGALTEDAELSKPAVDPCWVPAVAVARDQKLMPGAASPVAANRASELAPGRPRHEGAVRLGSGRVPKGLVDQIASVADELTEQGDLIMGPLLRSEGFRETA
jgi:hypothetical protein